MRDRKLSKVLDSLDRTHHGAMLVVGGRGIGKSWFLEQVAEHDSAHSIMLSASPNETGLPLSGVSAFLTAAGLNGIIGSDEIRSASSRQPHSTRALSETILTRLRDPESDRRIVLIDDLDGLDELSQEVLAFVFRRLGGTALQVVASLTTVHPGTAFTGLPTVTIDRMKQRDLDRLIAEFVDGPCAPAVACSISTAAEGRPGIALALIASLTRQQLSGQDPLPLPYVIPASRAQRIMDELPPMSEREWAILSAVSTAVGVAQGTLEALHPGCGSDVLGLIDKDVLTRTGSLVCFRRRYMRSAVYSAVEPCERIRLHARLADLTSGGMQAWHRSVDIDTDANRMLRVASGIESEHWGVELSIELAERAMTSSHGTLPDRESLARLAEAMMTHNELAWAERYAAFADSRKSRGDARSHVRLALVSAVVGFIRSGEVTDRRIDHVISKFSSREPAAISELLVILAIFQLDNWRADAAAAHLSAAKRLVRQPHEPLTAMTHECDALLHLIRGTSPSRQDDHRVPEVGNAPASILTAMRLAHEGEHDKARHHIECAIVSAAMTSPLFLGIAKSCRVAIELRAGCTAAAQSLIHQELEDNPQREANEVRWAFYAAWYSSEKGDARRAEASYQRGLQLAGPSTAVRFRDYFDSEQARRSMFRDGAADTASAVLARVDRRPGQRGNPQLARVAGDLVEAHVLNGNTQAATATLQQFETRAAGAPSLWSHHALARARAVVATGDAVDAVFEAAIDDFDDGEMPYELARTLLAYSSSLARRGYLARSTEVGELAERIFRAEGMAHWEALVTERCTVTAPPASLPLDVLDGRQREVVEHVGNGRSNREIAASLHVSVRTVEVRLTGAYRRLGVSSRSQLIALLSRIAVAEASAESSAH